MITEQENKQKETQAKKEMLASMTSPNPESINPIDGWIDIDRTKISYQGNLYDPSYRFQVKLVNAGLLKYFSTLDEENPLTIQDALLYVIKEHVKVWDGNKVLNTMDIIHEHDKFFFTMLVHLYSGSPTALQIEVVSPHDPNGPKQTVNVSPFNLVFKELTEKGMSYLQNDGSFIVKTKTLGDWKYKPLSCQQSIELSQFMLKQQREGKPIETFFMKNAGFFAHDPKCLTNGKFDPEKVYVEYLKISGDMKVSSMLIKAIEHIEPELLFEISSICEVTKKPFRAPITSLRGIKDIFLVSDSESELQ